MNTKPKNTRLAVAVARALEEQRRASRTMPAPTPAPVPLPQASPDVVRLLNWKTRRLLWDAAIAGLIVVGACLVLALVSGLDRLFDRVG